jgi:hypothetical protein
MRQYCRIAARPMQIDCYAPALDEALPLGATRAVQVFVILANQCRSNSLQCANLHLSCVICHAAHHAQRTPCS